MSESSQPVQWWMRSFVVLTVLFCLGTAGYVGPMWWARHLAFEWVEEKSEPVFFDFSQGVNPSAASWVAREDYTAICVPRFEPKVDLMKSHVVLVPAPRSPFFTGGTDLPAARRIAPWWGEFGASYPFWIPRQTYREALQRIANRAFDDDPDVWEDWFKAHPNLIWDAGRKELVEAHLIWDAERKRQVYVLDDQKKRLVERK